MVRSPLPWTRPSAWPTTVRPPCLHSGGQQLRTGRRHRRLKTPIISKPIADGTYPPGSQAPDIVELSAEFGIAASTAQKALAHLRGTGEVRTELSRYVRRRLEVGRLTSTALTRSHRPGVRGWRYAA
ncbi:GntR family transcriptional regulator [Streptomyces sp. CMSTAAHL-2]|nr:GntR family transcriptional regulator [Streptomyces sp. CMSTAAHL-2]